GRSPDRERPPRCGRARRALLAGGMTAPSTGLLEHTARFCRRLRNEGLPVGPGDTLAATRAIGSVGPMDRGGVRPARRAGPLKRGEDAPLFDALFDSFWSAFTPARRNPPVIPPDAEEDQERRGASSARRRSVESWQEMEELAVPAPSAREALGKQDFATFG